jgi:general L-amino acid transport system permease protein
MAAQADPGARQTLAAALLHDAKLRGIFYQAALLLFVLWLGYAFATNAIANLQGQGIATGIGFLSNTAGFSVSQSLIPYQESDTYGRVFVVGLLNTLLIAGLGVALATLLGFIVGIARLSSNWLLARLAGAYVELIRNLPLLFQMLFWYLAVLSTLPGPRQSFSLFGGVFLNNRGLLLPRPLWLDGSAFVFTAIAAAIAASIALKVWAERRRDTTGQTFPVLPTSMALIIGLPALAFVAGGFPLRLEWPQLTGFNFVGGLRIVPEFAALLIALTTYTASFIAEIVRAGVLAVPYGQTEAAASLGLRRGATLRLVVVPQALRVILPPLTSQYLNLTKNSSLATAIGYPDLFAVFAGTALNQTHQAIEIIAITMAVYLLISLVTSLLMNWYNARMRVVER